MSAPASKPSLTPSWSLTSRLCSQAVRRASRRRRRHQVPAPPSQPLKIWATAELAASFGAMATLNLWFGIEAPIGRFAIPSDGDNQAFMVLVRDEGGVIVYTATLTFAGLRLDGLSARSATER